MQKPTKNLEKRLLKQNYRYIIGIDEVGMGALAGPVVVCAVLFTKSFFQKPHSELAGVRDSKLLSAKQRQALAMAIKQSKGLRYKICLARPKTIDRLNIYKASRLAMVRAIQALPHKTKTIVLIDGPHKITDLQLPQLAIIKGDRKVFAIACASILAKVYRDKLLTNYSKHYPDYGFAKHKGYGTRQHLAQLITLGPCPIHRRSFAPVAKLI